MIDFDPETHTYTKDGLVVPNVTSILNPLVDLSKVPKAILEYKRQLGQAVHIATELDDKGLLDEASVSKEILPYLMAWRKFIDDTRFEPIEIEHRIFSKRHWYAGTLDRVGYFDGLSLIDIKTTVIMEPVAGPQTAAYSEAYNYRRKNKIRGRYAVQLDADGTYQLHEYTDKTDFSVFLSCLCLHNWRTKHGKH